MSADEFDVDIERLFGRTPRMTDAELFATRVEARLASGSRLRAVALTAAGLIGGVFAVRESMNFDFSLSADQPRTQTLGLGLEAAGGGANDAVQAVINQIGLSDMGLSDMGLGAMGGLPLFWIVAATFVALAAAGLAKLSQEA